MRVRTGWTIAAVVVGVAAALPAQAQCEKTAEGVITATGEGKAFSAATSASQRRLGAERAAYMDALTRLRGCMTAEELESLSAVTVAAVRYYDSEPLVEVDLRAQGKGPAKFVVIGSAAPKMDGKDINKVRIGATRAALTVARRNAAEALDLILPKGEKEGSARKSFTALLTRCDATEVSYWDDGAVSMKVECSEGAKAEKVELPAPAILEREGSDAENGEEDSLVDPAL